MCLTISDTELKIHRHVVKVTKSSQLHNCLTINYVYFIVNQFVNIKTKLRFKVNEIMIEKKLPDGTVVKAYPITSSQQMMYLMSLKYGSGYPVNNIGCGVYWKGEINKKEMKSSIYEAIKRCDTMRLRFVMGKKLQLLQYVTEKSELEVEEWDYTDMTIDEAEEKLTKFSRTNIPMFNCELHRIAIVHFKDGYKGLFMRIQHLAMDAYSLKVFINDIFDTIIIIINYFKIVKYIRTHSRGRLKCLVLRFCVLPYLKHTERKNEP